MQEIISVNSITEIIQNKAAIKYNSLYGLDDLSAFDKGYIMAMNEILNDIKYMEKIDL